METYLKLILFAVIGAICAIVISGGLSCMISESEPSPILLSIGAAAGGVLGSAVSYTSEGGSFNTLSDLANSYTEVVPEMKIGMPTF
jgi:hypothetical protein